MSSLTDGWMDGWKDGRMDEVLITSDLLLLGYCCSTCCISMLEACFVSAVL